MSAAPQRKIIVVCGTGGVGKTTLSAVLGIRAASRGRRTAVVTVDPAKRLADALGVSGLGDDPVDLSARLRLPAPLAAIVPDPRRSLEAFITRIAPTAELADRVLRNRLFRIFASEFSGANEYMALERLYRIHSQGLYDCIILDTPPSRNTLDFLEAPLLLQKFFDERILRWLTLPANQLLATGMKAAMSLMERLAGKGFMTDLLEFAQPLFETRASFVEKLAKIRALLASRHVGFIAVACPRVDQFAEISHFARSVREHGYHFDGVVLNRTLSALDFTPPPGGIPEDLRPAHELLRSLQIRENRAIEDWKGVLARLPELSRDIHSTEDLAHVAMASDLDRVV